MNKYPRLRRTQYGPIEFTETGGTNLENMMIVLRKDYEFTVHASKRFPSNLANIDVVCNATWRNPNRVELFLMRLHIIPVSKLMVRYR